MLLRLHVLFVFVVCFLFACSSDDVEEKTLIGRSVSGVRVQLDTLGEYKLSWNAPADLEYFEGYHFWVTNNEAYLGFDLRSEVNGDDFVSAEGVAYYSDSLGDPNLSSWIIPSDKIDLLDSDSLYVFVWAEFSSGQKAGARMGTPFFKGDIFPPLDVELNFVLETDSIVVNWLHAGDRRDLLDTSDLSGKVVGYQFYLEAASLEGVTLASLDSKTSLTDSAFWEVEKPFDISSVQTGIAPDTLNGGVRKSFFVENISAQMDDSLSFVIKGLKPAELYVVSVEAIDSVGNKLPSPKSFSVLTYSSFAPILSGSLSLDSMLGGAAYLSWPSAERNTLNEGVYSAISHYEVIYFDKLFTPERKIVNVLKHDTLERQMGVVWGVFNDRNYEFSLVAVDSTGKPSDTISVKSDLLTVESKCPEEAALIESENGSFCMQRWEATSDEARDTVIHTLSFDQALEGCEAYSSDKGLSWSLCTESQWDESCLQGSDADYGVIQGDLEPIELLEGVCNLSTGVPLDSFAQRNGRCVNSFGVFDLPGQYQEWVVDSSGLGRIRGGSWKQPSSGTGYSVAACGSRVSPVLLHSPFALLGQDTVVELFGQRVIWNDSLEVIYGDLSHDSTDIIVVGANEFVDSLHILQIGAVGKDTVLVSELPKNSAQWSDVYQGLSVSLVSTVAGLKVTGDAKKYNRFYRSNSLSYRCCAKVE